MEIARSPRAIEDMDEIWLYVAEHNQRAADRLIERLEVAIGKLLDFPHRGAPKPRAGKGFRSINVGSYLIYCVVRDETIVIVRVVHGACDTWRLLF